MAAYHQYIRDAIDMGCWFDFSSHEYVSFTGHRRKPMKYGTQRYPSITLSLNKTFPLHKFVAYQLFGDEAFSKGTVVRHLDGDTLNLSKDNIVLGTYSQNEKDKPAHVRNRSAKLARASQGRPNNARFTDDEVREIRQWYKWMRERYPNKLPNGSVTFVANWYGVSRGCIGNIVIGNNWKDINV